MTHTTLVVVCDESIAAPLHSFTQTEVTKTIWGTLSLSIKMEDYAPPGLIVRGPVLATSTGGIIIDNSHIMGS